MRKKLINMVYIMFIVLSAIFILKTVYVQSYELIHYQSFERLTGTIIASILSVLVCLIACISSIKNIVAKRGK